MSKIFLTITLLIGSVQLSHAGIAVAAVFYGSRCSSGDQKRAAFKDIRLSCDGKEVCNYTIDPKVIGELPPSCEKVYTVEYSCSENYRPNSTNSINVTLKAGSKTAIVLNCRAEGSKSTAPASEPLPTTIQSAPVDPKVQKLVEVVREVGEDAARTLTVWYRLKMEPPPPLFNTFPEVTDSAWKERNQIAGKLEHLFGTQVEMDLSKARIEGRGNAVRTYALIMQSGTDENPAKILDSIGDFTQPSWGAGDAELRAAIARSVRDVIEAQSRAGESSASVEETPSQAASAKFTDLLKQVQKIGTDAAQTLQIWWELRHEPTALVFDSNPDVAKGANDEREAVAGKIPSMFGTEMVMDLSMAKMQGRSDAITAFEAIIGAQRIIVVPMSAGRAFAPGREETVEKAVQDLGDFHQPSSEGAHSALRKKITDAVGPLMDGR